MVEQKIIECIKKEFANWFKGFDEHTGKGIFFSVIQLNGERRFLSKRKDFSSSGKHATYYVNEDDLFNLLERERRAIIHTRTGSWKNIDNVYYYVDVDKEEFKRIKENEIVDIINPKREVRIVPDKRIIFKFDYYVYKKMSEEEKAKLKSVLRYEGGYGGGVWILKTEYKKAIEVFEGINFSIIHPDVNQIKLAFPDDLDWFLHEDFEIDELQIIKSFLDYYSVKNKNLDKFLELKMMERR